MSTSKPSIIPATSPVGKHARGQPLKPSDIRLESQAERDMAFALLTALRTVKARDGPAAPNRADRTAS